MAFDELRIGIIGCGALGLVHAERFTKIPGVRLVAISDPISANRDRLAASIARKPEVVVQDYKELLAAGLDAVCIASPDIYHVPQVLDALDAGLHVLCEKPLTESLDKLQTIEKKIAAMGKMVSLTYPRRYDASIRAMREDILSGKWGKVTSVTAYNAEDWITPNRGTWRHDPEICPGGFFYDASGHQLDTVFWCTGLQTTEVRAHLSKRGSRVPLVVWGDALFGAEVPFTFHFVGDAQYWREQIVVHCEKMDFVVLQAKAHWVQNGQLVPMAPGEPDESSAESFVSMLRTDSTNWAPVSDVFPIVEFTAAALKSAGG